MALVLLRAPLSDLAGGREHALEGDTVLDVLVALEHACPSVSGWILDERRAVRTHVNIYVNGELAESGTTVGDADRIYVLPAITGGSE
jgi:molybdopterin converting factor small subunit